MGIAKGVLERSTPFRLDGRASASLLLPARQLKRRLAIELFLFFYAIAAQKRGQTLRKG